MMDKKILKILSFRVCFFENNSYLPMRRGYEIK